jgi:hypothetical protein
MPISTNSIIHYTDTFAKLKGILTEGLGIKYCSENLLVKGQGGSAAVHPMISFCDIPLSQSYKHFDAYGKYGLGLTKSWANTMGINPVLYMESNSSIIKTLISLLENTRDVKTNLTVDQKLNILKIKCFTKNYSGPLKRKDVDDKDYRFYDEREWRLVPDKNELNGARFSIAKSTYEKDKERINNQISSIRFTFEHDDIAYIIVDKTSEIPKVIKILRDAYSNKCTAQQLDILFSKISSTEQIISDY